VSAALESLMQAAAQVAQLAGDVAAGYFGMGVAVDLKADGSPVTIADRTAEERARAWIEQRFPADGILGEEFGVTRPDARRRWVLDPIDGTKSFVRGVPLWGTLVAVCEGEEVLAGAVYLPMAGELVVAAPGCGAWANGARCQVSGNSAVAGATVLTTDERFSEAPHYRGGWERLSHRASVSRTWGDCYGYVLVATGRAEAMVDPVLSPWDAAAVMPIVTEAGGVFTSWTGQPTAFGGSAVATNAALAREVRLLLAGGEASAEAVDDGSAEQNPERGGA
jgi:histidinol phosphatase-like enzyme (inositol monophosphatase family)